MINSEFKAEKQLRLDEYQVIPVVKSTIVNWHKNSLTFSAQKAPCAIVVICGDEKKVYRPSGEEISLADLYSEAPEMRGKF